MNYILVRIDHSTIHFQLVAWLFVRRAKQKLKHPQMHMSIQRKQTQWSQTDRYRNKGRAGQEGKGV